MYNDTNNIQTKCHRLHTLSMQTAIRSEQGYIEQAYVLGSCKYQYLQYKISHTSKLTFISSINTSKFSFIYLY